jgi:hypothetical protein
MTVLARVLALVERAAHDGTPEEEARTSAVIACKLIHKHDLLRLLPPAAEPKKRGSAPRPTPKPTQKETSDPDAPVILLGSKYAGRCKACGFTYEVGDRVWWRRGYGATHERCEEYWNGNDD